jgi:hypothetical protein
MFAWLSGTGEPLENASQSAAGVDSDTILEAPETPAPVFAMRAFKQVLFGTPQITTPVPPLKELPPIKDVPPNKSQRLQPSETQKLLETTRGKQSDTTQQAEGVSTDSQSVQSPSKPTGILMTPGTINGRRKQVKFGEQVVDNEGKRGKYSKSGLPDNCPGKFPSPWTPKSIAPLRATAKNAVLPKPTAAAVHDKKVESRFKEILDIGRNPKPTTIPVVRSTEQRLIRPPRSKDDGDVTTDLTLPRSASGRYWKDQYEQYSSNSVVETKRLIAKHRLAKDYARMKDDEAQGLRSQLDLERRKRGRREGSLEVQVKELRGRLRDALADNAKLSAEVTAMRMQLEGQGMLTQEKSVKAKSTETTSVSKFSKLMDEPKKDLGAISTVTASGDIWLDTDTDGETATRARRLRRSPKNEQLAPQSRIQNSTRTKTHSPARVTESGDTSRLPQLSPLSERSLNLPTSTPTTIRRRMGIDDIGLKGVEIKQSKTLKVRPMSPNFTHGSILQLDFTAPLEALTLQASQPTTPKVDTKQKSGAEKTPSSNRSRNKPLSIEGQRLEEARLRVAERRKTKRDSRTKVRA